MHIFLVSFQCPSNCCRRFQRQLSRWVFVLQWNFVRLHSMLNVKRQATIKNKLNMRFTVNSNCMLVTQPVTHSFISLDVFFFSLILFLPRQNNAICKCDNVQQHKIRFVNRTTKLFCSLTLFPLAFALLFFRSWFYFVHFNNGKFEIIVIGGKWTAKRKRERANGKCEKLSWQKQNEGTKNNTKKSE